MFNKTIRTNQTLSINNEKNFESANQLRYC